MTERAKKGKRKMKYENEMEIDVGRCLRAIVRKWWFIALMAVFFGVAGIALTWEKGADEYGATSSVYSVSAGSYKESQTGTSAMNDYAEIATSMKVCERAALLMGNADITGRQIMSATNVTTSGNNTSTTGKNNSTLLKITSYSNDPVIAMEMSQAVAEAFIIEMQNILGTDDVQLLDKPYNYFVSYDATKSQWKIRILSVLVGAVLAMTVIVMTELFDTKTRTIRECTLREELPIIGVIPECRD